MLFGSNLEVTTIQHWNDFAKPTWRIHRYFSRFLKCSRHWVIHIESMSSFWRGFAFYNLWNIDELSTWNFIVEIVLIARYVQSNIFLVFKINELLTVSNCIFPAIFYQGDIVLLQVLLRYQYRKGLRISSRV